MGLSLVSCRIGFDASAGPYNSNSMACLKNNGFSFAIFRAYRSYGIVDPNAKANIRGAHAGGINDVDVYIFPCFKCGNPEQQIIAMVNGLSGEKYNWIWIDVEAFEWGGRDANRQFLQRMFNEAPKHGKSVGVYTNSNGWNNIVGNDWTAGSRFPLWWAYWDDNPSFANFRPFAGWRAPMIKQYQADKTICNVGLDKNFKA